MGQRWKVDSVFSRDQLFSFIDSELEQGNSVLLGLLKNKRTLDQNSMINALYGQIAAQAEDLTAVEVRRYCKLHFGVVLLKSVSPDFCEFYDRLIRKRCTYEEKLQLMDHMAVTSTKDFTTKVASEYIDTIIREYSRQGYRLTHPRDQYDVM